MMNNDEMKMRIFANCLCQSEVSKLIHSRLASDQIPIVAKGFR